MRFLLSLLLALPLMASAQLCSEPSPVSYAGFGYQQTGVDYLSGSDYLDPLNNSSYWSLGTGISDNNLCVLENGDITTFLGVKLRNTTAPNDNPSSTGNVYHVEPGYSPATQNGSAGSGPEAKWNILMYAGVDGGAFDSVDVVLHIDFDPCFGYTESDMYSINIGEAFDSNPFTQAQDFSSFGINTNLGSTEIANLNPAGTGFDATIEGYYTFAIEVLNNCGTRKAWNEITVYVQSTTTDGGSAVADANGNGVYDDNDIVGCQNEAACNYDCNATTNSGCEYVSCSGCTVIEACNYNPDATVADSESCDYPLDLYGATHFDCDGNCLNDTDSDGVCDEDEISGCQDAAACNYDATATDDSGACTYPATHYNCAGDCLNDADSDGVCDELEIDGCTASNACNYDATATDDDGTCEYDSCAGCTVSNACNYDATKTISDLVTCVYANGCDSCSGETDGSGTVVDGDSDNDGVCDVDEIPGCTDDAACNYDATATDDDASCATLDALGVCGGPCASDSDGDGICDDADNCTDTAACNFDDAANEVCESISCAGCTVVQACNYDASATISTLTCVYASGCDTCSGENDGTGEVVDGDTDNDGVCNDDEVFGCTNANALNFNVYATEDDGSCELAVSGCMLPFDCNYNAAATTMDISACSPAVGGSTPCSGGMMGGSPPPMGMVTTCTNEYACNFGEEGACEFTSCIGCTDPTGCDYDADNIYPVICDFTCYGCTNPAADNYDAGDPATIDDGSCVISGCTNDLACNYNSAATSDDASCEFTSCVGCMDATACNYDDTATLNELLQCVYATGCDSCSGATDGSGTVVDGDADDDGVCDADEVDGCTDSNACNYEAAATEDNGTCQYLDACGVCGGAGVDTDGDGVCDAEEVVGCMSSAACNYDASATDDAGCDFTSCVGCMDDTACTFDPTATLNQPLDCEYPDAGYDCADACLNDADSDGVCDEFEVAGCTDADACNYSADATDENGSCTYPAEDYLDCAGNCLTDEDEDGVCDEIEVFGCDIESACNYNASATENDGSCEFTSCAGCTDATACNYDPTATLSNNITCTYIPAGWDDCDQTICTDSDNDGICDFDEPAGCVGEFNEPSLSLSTVVETAVAVADWASTDFAGAATDDTGVDGTTFVDYAGRLNDGRYSVTRVYTTTDVCANSSEAAQLIIADDSHPAGCTNPNATSYDAAAVNDDGTCDYSPACLGDLNLDNIVGTSDLLILLSSFGLPCPE